MHLQMHHSAHHHYHMHYLVLWLLSLVTGFGSVVRATCHASFLELPCLATLCVSLCAPLRGCHSSSFLFLIVFGGRKALLDAVPHPITLA